MLILIKFHHTLFQKCKKRWETWNLCALNTSLLRTFLFLNWLMLKKSVSKITSTLYLRLHQIQSTRNRFSQQHILRAKTHAQTSPAEGDFLVPPHPSCIGSASLPYMRLGFLHLMCVCVLSAHHHPDTHTHTHAETHPLWVSRTRAGVFGLGASGRSYYKTTSDPARARCLFHFSCAAAPQPVRPPAAAVHRTHRETLFPSYISIWCWSSPTAVQPLRE
jgi:hypothetical protein